MTGRPRLLYLITEDWYFWSHRLDLARAARDAGFDVTIATRVTDHGKQIQGEGFHLVPISLFRRSRNPIRELGAVTELISVYGRVRPHLVHHVAMKPILYGSLAAWVVRVPAILNAFAGLGYLFANSERQQGGLHRVLTAALRSAIGRSGSTVLFQNEADRDELVQAGTVRTSHTRVIAGSGIDINAFSVKPSPPGIPLVVLPARMLWDKGVGEFVQAARMLKGRGVDARFVLVGRCDEDNPADIGREQLARWMAEGAVEWWGHRDDMSAVYAEAALVVLPSYREGLPKVLLEAAACGKAIVATDVPGCRDVVRHGVNGMLVPPKDASAIADSITTLLKNEGLREELGRSGRNIAVKEFSAAVVNEQTLALYRELLQGTAKDSLSRKTFVHGASL
ncbi:MAG TPA: glycosyltransferase family 4 protein [Nitrospira sp.]|nr:glycosyltransferase family 4 protein [Nitrospira sp.]